MWVWGSHARGERKARRGEGTAGVHALVVGVARCMCEGRGCVYSCSVGEEGGLVVTQTKTVMDLGRYLYLGNGAVERAWMGMCVDLFPYASYTC